MASAASASPSWVILGSVARVTAADADLPPGADLSLTLPAPPRVALLNTPPRVFPGRATHDNFLCILAADASGHLLLHGGQGPATGPTTIDLPNRQEVFVLTTKSASFCALPLPNPNAKYIMDPGRLGLVISPADDSYYMVAEL
jgi:hypothetical protein